jgi:methylated-DNA-[protein]-cysteine S-methyltransferase
MIHSTIPSPVGPLLLAADDAGLRVIEFPSPRHRVQREDDWQEGDHPVLREARSQLDAYFAGTLHGFDLPLAPRGTAFQQQVWMALREIPYGKAISYAELALRIGKPAAMRAVGSANGRNPLPIVVPCHRVIGADGSLTGFGGGLPTKQFLLQLEGALATADLPPADLFAAPSAGSARRNSRQQAAAR